MSEFESGSGSGSGRKGFMRDMVRRISSPGPRAGEPDAPAEPTATPPTPERGTSAPSYQEEVENLRDAARFFGSDSSEFRRRIDRLLAEFEALRRRHELTREQRTTDPQQLSGRPWI